MAFPGGGRLGIPQPIGISTPFGLNVTAGGLPPVQQTAPVAPGVLQLPPGPPPGLAQAFQAQAQAPIRPIFSTGGGIADILTRTLAGGLGGLARGQEREAREARAKAVTETLFPDLDGREAETAPERFAMIGRLLGDENISLAAAQAQLQAGVQPQFDVLTGQQEIEVFGRDRPGAFQRNRRTSEIQLIPGTGSELAIDSFEPIRDAQGKVIGQRNTRTGRRVADPTVATPSPEDKFKLPKFTADLRKEAAGISGDFILQEQAIGRVNSVAFEADGVTVRQTPASSLALVFNFMKVLDPGSVVRESEFRTAAAARAWLERRGEDGLPVPTNVVSAIQQLQGLGTLTPSQIRDFASTAQAIFDGAADINALQLAPLAETLRANDIAFNQVFSKLQAERLQRGQEREDITATRSDLQPSGGFR